MAVSKTATTRLISVSIFIFCFVLNKTIFMKNYNVYIQLLASVTISTCCYYLFKLVLKVKLQKKAKKRKVLIAQIEQYLSYTKLKQVFLNDANYDKNSQECMMRKILKKEGCRFYAKLENNSVHLVVFDKNNTNVYECLSLSPFYFCKHFIMVNE